MKIIGINLLPPEELPESPFSFRNIVILVISFLIATCLIVLALQMNNSKKEYTQQRKELTQQLAVYRMHKKKIDKLQEKKDALEQRYKLITDALGKRMTWYDKLIVMHRQVPDNLWFSQVSMETQEVEKTQPEKQKRPSHSKNSSKPKDSESEKETVEKHTFFRITGYTKELPKVGQLIANLDSSEFFGKTKFNTIQKIKIDTHSVIAFEIITQVIQEGD